MTTLGVNVGDEFIREGIRAVLDRIGVPYEPLYVNKHDPSSLTQPHEDESHLVTDKYWDSDIFIQAGAPVYWHLHRGQSRSVTSEWHNWLWRKRILSSAGREPVFLNLGAGSCQPWGDVGDCFLADAECCEFARSAARRSTLTVVRDDVAARILERLQVSHERLCCPAFLAAARHRLGEARPKLLGINLMPLGAHYDLHGNFDRERWKRRCEELCRSLRQWGRLIFIAHDAAEVDFMKPLVRPDERIFMSSHWRSYLDVYSSCEVVAANRVHGAVCAAGFGVPSVIIGNDTRARIGDYMGIPVCCSADLDPAEAAQLVGRLVMGRASECVRLLKLREAALDRYERLLSPLIAQAARPKDAALATSA